MDSIKKKWLDNPCRTIVEYAQLQVMQRKNTVRGSLMDLKYTLDMSHNEYAKVRLNHILELMDKHIDKKISGFNNYLIQGTIIEQVKDLLENYTE